MSDTDAIYGPSLVRAIGTGASGRVTFVGPTGAHDVSCDDPNELLDVLATGVLPQSIWLRSDSGVAFRLEAMYTAEVSTALPPDPAPVDTTQPAPGGP